MPALRRASVVNLQCEHIKGLPDDPGIYHPHHRSARYQRLTLDAPFIQLRHDDACVYARTQADTSAEEVRCAAQGILRICLLYVLCLFRQLLVHLITRIHGGSHPHLGLQSRILQLDGEAGDAGAVTARTSFHRDRHTHCRFSIPPVPFSVAHIPQSLMTVIILPLLPAMTPKPPKRILALRPYERKIVLTEEQILSRTKSTPTPPPSTLPSCISHELSKTCQRIVRYAACAQRATTLKAALGALFTPAPKRVHAEIPAPVDPKTLATGIPRVSKGPAPTVGPARSTRMRRRGVLPTVVEEGSGESAVCAGW
ncbi:hypothetical protein DFH08DRAFT_1033991 [Mycena albidolilacea]|uniref:Uncharacterized protein n=1 Tax=Mycena albidolilacea TaxID=1033008 RepID=A0AAD6ZH90_9AGAR|nr:hypothetical protein DFH08DRAFT_1033991 [Mycena albidolilacea]